MNWRLVVGVLAVLTTQACIPPGHPARTSGCAPGPQSYQTQDVVLRLDQRDRGRTFRLPLGGVVVAPPGVCANPDVLEILGSPVPPDANLSSRQAFRAIQVGSTQVAWYDMSGGEVAMMSYSVTVTVTPVCQPLSRQAAIDKVLNRNPVSLPQGSSPRPRPASTSSKLIRVSQYSLLSTGLVQLNPETFVWAVLLAYAPEGDATPTPERFVWSLFVVDVCTDWLSQVWEGTAVPPGWTSLADASA